jgi:hypothetical protein
MTPNYERRPGSRNRASLVVHSDDLTPEEITNVLHVKPTASLKKGSSRTPASKPVESHTWSLECVVDRDVRIEHHIEWLLDQIEPRKQEFAALLAEGRCTARIQAAIADESGQYPLTLDAELLRRLTAAPIDLWLTAWMSGGTRARDESSA